MAAFRLEVHGHLALHPAGPDIASATPGGFPAADFVLDGCSGRRGRWTWAPWIHPSGRHRLTLDHQAVLHVQGLLILRQGSELIVESDAALHLDHGSLILEPAARLTLKPGSVLRLSGDVNWMQQDGTITRLDGHVTVDPEAEWPVQLLGNARFTTTGTVFVQRGQGAQMVMHSASEEGVWLLGTGAHVVIDGLGQWTWDGMGIRMAGDGRSAAASSGQTWSSSWRHPFRLPVSAGRRLA